jgi:Acetyltransferase (GNAT) domain
MPLDRSCMTSGNEVQIVNPLGVADWDDRISGLPEATFFHTSAWARVVHETYGYEPVYFVQGGLKSFEAVLPLMEVDSWLTGRRGVSLPFTDACEPLCQDAATFDHLFSAARDHGKKRNWKYLECRGGRKWMESAPASTSFFNHRLNLAPDEATLIASFGESTRRALRKAQQSGLTVEFAQTLEATRSFYELLCKTRRRHGVPPQPFSFFANIHRHVFSPGKGWVVIIKKESVAVAGAVFFHFNRSSLFKFGASDEGFKQYRPNNLVMWEAIRWHKEQGFKAIDFGRTSLGNEGLRRFKSGWCAEERRGDYLRFSLKPGQFVTSADHSAGVHTRFFNALPIGFAKILGRFLYHHLG